MIRAVIHARTWLLAIICLTAFGACRRVTIISFHTDVVAAPAIDKLTVNLNGIAMKHSQELHGLDEKLGLFDLPRDETEIEISAFGCSGGFIKLFNAVNDDPPPNPYPIASDAVLVTMVTFPSDYDIPCPLVESDGGVSGEPTGAGGAADSGSGDSEGGDAGIGGAGMGGAAGGGLGGMPGIGGMGGGANATGGAGGGGDAGQGGADGGTCVAPNGPSPGPTPVGPTQACMDYCDQIIGSADGGPPLCPDTYERLDQCQQYCTRAAWTAGTMKEKGDTMACRMNSLSMIDPAHMLPSALKNLCLQAGPSGGTSRLDPNGCGMASVPSGMCTVFCSALAQICPDNANGCMTACQNAPSSEPACRFPWLLRAATDQRYCALVDFAGSCRPPGC